VVWLDENGEPEELKRLRTRNEKIYPFLPPGWADGIRAELEELVRRRGTELSDSKADLPYGEASRAQLSMLTVTEIVASEMAKVAEGVLNDVAEHFINEIAPKPVKERVLMELREHPENRRMIFANATRELLGSVPDRRKG